MACTTILVGKKASYDGSTMIARNDDGFFDEKRLTVVLPKDQPRKYKCKISHLEIVLPDDPLRYTSTPSVDLSKGIWAANGYPLRAAYAIRGDSPTLQPQGLESFLWRPAGDGGFWTTYIDAMTGQPVSGDY